MEIGTDAKGRMKIDAIFIVICYLIWGFQPLYFNLRSEMDSLFLLMSRIFWAGICVTGMLILQGRGKEIIGIFKNRQLMWKHLIPGALFDFLDLALYLWAVTNGHILATSLGYYVAPLVICMIGVVVFKERFTWQLAAAAAVILTGIILSGGNFGDAPLVSIALMFCFSIYAACMRGVKEDSVICTAVQMLLMMPFALVSIFLFRLGDNGLASLDISTLIYLIAAGIIMVVPIILYASCVKRVPFVIMGFTQYLSPTFGIVCSLLLHETISSNQMIVFGAIWIAILVYSIATAVQQKKVDAHENT